MDLRAPLNILFLSQAGQHEALAEIILGMGYSIETNDQLDEVLKRLQTPASQKISAIVLTELKNHDLLSSLIKLKKANKEIPIIALSEDASSRVAIEMIKAGAYDFFVLPTEQNELQDAIKHAAEEARKLSKPVEIGNIHSDQDTIVGHSRPMRNIYKQLGRIAAQPVTVLVRGETGTGKELIARAIYQHGHRAHKPFIAVNCAAIPENLLESELFGHEKGAFTGAQQLRIGRFEQAHGGTLFLDEIGDLDLQLQVKLLRVLQEKSIQRIGSSKNIPVDVRIIAATHRDLEKMVQDGEFREDLFYRLNVVSVTIPPLRERREDIPELVTHFIQKYSREFQLELPNLSSKATDFLAKLDWPGNIRQLQNVISKALLESKGYTLDWQHFRHILEASQLIQTHKDSLKEEIASALTQALNGEIEAALPKLTHSFEKQVYSMAIERTQGNQAQAARILGISRFTLREKLRHYGLHPVKN